MKKLLAAILSVVLITAVAICISYYMAINKQIPIKYLNINEENIHPTQRQSSVSVIPFGLYDVERAVLYSLVEIPVFEIKSNEFTMDIDGEYTLRIVFEDSEVFSGEDISLYSFDKVGQYYISLTTQGEIEGSFTVYDYDFIVSLTEEPVLNISNTSPLQGELVKVDISGIFNDYAVEIDCHFSPSSHIFKDNTVTFYIPITYYAQAQDYPLSFTLKQGEEVIHSFDTVLEVAKDEYETISFTVDESVENSTVNSAAANQEYRDTIHPLYYTKDENLYWEGNFIKPTQETRISSGFGQYRYINGVLSRHSGIDYAAPTGTEIIAPNHGVVEYAGFLQLSGNTIVIEHGMGLKSYYFHMDSLSVNTNDFVQKGDLIGTVGTTGYSTGPHLHYQISIENQPINPEFLYNIQ